MHKKSIYKAIVAIAVTLAFLMPCSTAFTNDEEPFISNAISTVIPIDDAIEAFNPIVLDINNFDKNWIHFDDGTNTNAVGRTNDATWETAIRITPDELVGYDGYNFTTVRWHHGWAGGTPQPPHSGNIKIYDAGTSTKPGSLITSEPYTVTETDWADISLSNPIIIDASKDIWVSVEVTQKAGEHPFGCGPGPAVAGKGFWVCYQGQWDELQKISSIDGNWNIWAGLEVITDPPEKPQRPDGPTEGVVGVEYTFCTSTTDPEGEQVFYMWDWGDDTSTDWLGPYDSGATACASHIWTEAGSYDIKVKAKDIHDVESDWSDPKAIYIIDRPILEIGNISGGLFKVSMVIKNIGGDDADSVNWSIILDGGFILLGKKTTGSIMSLSAGDEVTISSGLIIGFGKTVITVTAETTESSDIKEQDAFVLLFFIKI